MNPSRDISQRLCHKPGLYYRQRTTDADELDAAPHPQVSTAKHDDATNAAEALAAYTVNAEWIRFADVKAGVTVALNGAFASLLIPTLSDLLDSTLGWPSRAAYALLGAWAVAALVSSMFALRCILPFTRRGRHPAVNHAPHFHSAAIAVRYSMDDYDEFVRNYTDLGAEGFRREILASLLADAHIAKRKYRCVKWAVRLLAAMAAAGFAYLTLLQLIMAL